MANLCFDSTKIVKKMKPMHGGGQPPLSFGMNKGIEGNLHYIAEAGIPFSRLHDVGGVFGGNRFVDIPNIFRDFDADENDPANYDFTFTDLLIKSLIDAGIEPYYRLGVTIENQAYIKTYYATPPKDYAKWARICEHIMAHYLEGWADGFHYNIRYWEIWNEPEVQDQMMWNGTPEQYYELYHVAATHLKKRFPYAKIGGYASCGFYAIAMPEGKEPTEHYKSLMTFFEGFFAYIKEHGSPIDFFSWHSYTHVGRVKIMDQWLHNRLEELGYGGLETHLNEWNPYAAERGTAHHSAEVAAMMLALQHGHTDAMMIYDMRTNTVPYAALFDVRTKKPIQAYYAMVAFNTLYRLGNQVELTCDEERLYTVAASDGVHHAIMLSNLTGQTQELNFQGVDFQNARYYVIDQQRLLSWAPHAKTLENNAVMLIEF